MIICTVVFGAFGSSSYLSCRSCSEDKAGTGARLQEIWWTFGAIPSFSAAIQLREGPGGKCLYGKCHEFWSRNSSSLPISLTSSSSRKNSSMSWILNHQCRRACGHIVVWLLKRPCDLKALRKETSTCECQAKLLIKLGACLCRTLFADVDFDGCVDLATPEGCSIG